MRLKLLTPSTIPTATISRCLVYPDSIEWRAIIAGLVGNAIDAAEWQEHGAITPDEAADRCREMFNAFFESEDCSMLERLIGEIVFYAADSVPSKFLSCDGQAVNRVTYADLFAALGVAWGAGNGTTTFNLPDLRGRSPIGKGTAVGATGAFNMPFANVAGEAYHELSTGELPSHKHQQSATNSATGALAHNGAGSNAKGSIGAFTTLTAIIETQPTGGGATHNTLHPVTVGRFIVYSGVPDA